MASFAGSESSTTMSEVVKSKFKLYDALKKDKGTGTETNSLKDIYVSSGVVALETPVSVNKRKEVNVSGGTSQVELSESTVGQQAMGQSLHEFKKPKLDPASENVEHLKPTVDPSSHIIGQSLHKFKNPELETSTETIAPLIEFVPPASEQTIVCSTSRKKLNRKKKKAKKKMEHQSP